MDVHILCGYCWCARLVMFTSSFFFVFFCRGHTFCRSLRDEELWEDEKEDDGEEDKISFRFCSCLLSTFDLKVTVCCSARYYLLIL